MSAASCCSFAALHSASTSGRLAAPGAPRLFGRHQSLGVPLALPTLRRVRRAGAAFRLARLVCSFGAAGAWGGDSGTGYDTLTHLAQLTGFAIGALFIGRELVMEREREKEPRDVCESCNGTGRVACVCQRWSDDDSGCGTCGNTGMMACKDCHGGGTKVPVARVIPIYAKNEDRYRRGPYGCDGHSCQSCRCHESHSQ